jgi:hypothetical protein
MRHDFLTVRTRLRLGELLSVSMASLPLGRARCACGIGRDKPDCLDSSGPDKTLTLISSKLEREHPANSLTTLR